MISETAMSNSSQNSTGLRDVPAWVVSLALHVVVLFVMGSITHVAMSPKETTIISRFVNEVPEEELRFDVSQQDQLGADINMGEYTPSLSASTDPTSQEQPETEIANELQEDLVNIEVPTTQMPVVPTDAELTATVDVTGDTEHTGGVEGAMDRITFELASALRDGPTMAIWIFDASKSLNEERDAIANRFENVYKQLGLLDIGGNEALLTGVVSFGEKVNFLTDDPVSDVRDVSKAIRQIKPDSSGVERVFTAVNAATNKWLIQRTKKRRNILVFIVTDERGDDLETLEQTIAFQKRFGIRCYCIGDAALFGREQLYVRYIHEEDGEQFVLNLPVDKGAETVYPERLELAFWGNRNRDLDRMSASFGPYALTRLCAETGGLYLVSQDLSATVFDPSVMRNYPPDYRPIRTYEQEMRQNRAKAALVQAAMGTRATEIPLPQLEFRADSDNILRQQVTEAQKPLAVLDYRLDEMHRMLEEGAKDRAKLKEARWRAGYDLAMGRVLAMRARAFGFNSMMAEMKSSPKKFENSNNNHWRLEPAPESDAGPAVRKLIKGAREYLTRVVDEHPNTPWALLASQELSTPMGWAWEEFQREVPQMGPNGERPPGVLFADEPNMNNNNRPKPKVPKNPPKL